MTQQIENVKASCLGNWCANGELDSRLMKFEENFDKWLLQIPKENRTTVITLVKNLAYYSHRTTNKWLRELHKQLIKNKEITDENTIYAFIKSKYGKTNSSNDYWTEYKAINEINKHICIENMDAIEDDAWPYIQNIIFIDDFSGTGNSFIEELKKNPLRYKHKSIYFITIDIMSDAIERIHAYCDTNEINVTLLSANKQDKTFERELFADNDKAKSEIVDVSHNLPIPNCFILGYEESQALVVFYNNTPNNTLGFIWHDAQKYSSLFPRKNDKIPHWREMKKEKSSRNNANYNNKAGDK